MAVAAESPIAAYSFDEGEGATAEDLTGNAHTATIEGATWAKGRYGGALSFDGENDCVSVPESPEFQFLADEELTFEAWVRPSKEEQLSAILTQEDEGFNEETEEAPYAYSMLTGAGEAPSAWFRKAGEFGHVGVGGGETPGNAWTHIAVTDDGAHLRFYVDGELVNTEDSIPLTAAEGPLTIGCLDAFGNHFEGRIDEVRIYDRALEAGEVAADRATPIETPRQAPIAAYSFDEGEGSTLHDLTGNGHDGAIEGAAWSHGRYGGALHFDGEDDCVSVPSSLDLNLAEEFTLQAWVRPDASRQFTPVFLREGGAEESYSLYLGAFDAGQLEGFVVDESPGFAGVDSGEALPNKAWSHVAMSSDGNKLRLYLDGQLLDTASAREALESEGDLYLGCFPGQEQFFEGRIDEIRIYNRSLDAGELAADRATPIQTPHRDPVAAYSFDEGEGATVEDLTGNSHTATIEGSTWAKGRYGGALQFDGENDCVSIPESAQFQFLADEEFTFEAWVRPSKEEQLSAIVTQEDEAFDEETEEAPYAYTMLAGAGEGARGWFRKAGEFGHVSVAGGETPGNAWTHIAVTDDGAKLRLYVDGELVNTEAAIPLTAAEGPLTIGCLAAFGNHFEGRIDEVRIYDRALGAGEVAGDKAAPIETPQQSPIAAYSFDEGEGATLKDLSGNGHDGAIEGAAWVRGKYGGALSFDGENDCVSVPSSIDLNLAEEFTLEAWVRPDASRQFTPVFLREGGAEESYSLYLGAFDAGQLEGFVVDESPGFAGVDSGEALPNKAWSHVAMTSDGDKLRLYVDGELVDTASAREALESEGDLYLGCFPGQGQFFEGRIDEVRIYNRALEVAELAADKETPIQTPHRDPIAAYSFDEGEGATAEDLTGNAHTATIEGATWAKGRYGGALSFDGENDCVSVPESPEFQFLADEELTFEAWVRPSKEEQLSAVITQEDEAFDEETEEAPYAYSMLTGAGEAPSAWFRKAGEFGHVGVGGGETPGNAWTHIAVTDDGAHLRFYVDGELVNTEDSIPLTAAEGPLTIGCLDAFGNHFDGRIDEVRIYDRALEAGEVADIKAPVFSDPFEVFAVNVPSMNQPVVSFQQAVDPPMLDGMPGSGVSEYLYRYAIQEEPFGSWNVASQPYFEVTSEAEGKEITVEVYAIDAVGNHSERVRATTEVAVESFPPQTEEQEGFVDEKRVDGPEETWKATGGEEEGEFSTFAEGPGGVATCHPHLDNPHRSRHVPGRINVIMRMECKGTMVSKGFITATLWRIKEGGKHDVIGYSGEVNFAGLIVDKKASANATCVTGWYRGFGGAFAEWPPSSIPPNRLGAFITKAVHVSC